MADVDSLMVFGLAAEQAKAVVAIPTRLDVDPGELAATKVAVKEDLIRLGFHAEMAELLVNEGAVDRLMALGMPALLATDVNTILTA